MILPKDTPYEEFIQKNIEIYQREYGLSADMARECAQTEWDIRQEVRSQKLKPAKKAYMNSHPGFGTKPIHIIDESKAKQHPPKKDHQRRAVKRAHEEASHQARLRKLQKLEEQKRQEEKKLTDKKLNHGTEANTQINTARVNAFDSFSKTGKYCLNCILFEKFKERRVIKVSEANLLLNLDPQKPRPQGFPTCS